MNKRRLAEWLKSLLILLLTASAVWLLTLTPLVQDSGLSELFSGSGKEIGAETEVELISAAHPSRMAVVGLSGRYGVQYDQEAVDELFFRFGSLLGDAMVTAGEPQVMEELLWRDCLDRTGVYFDFESEIPLSALGSWLQSGGTCSLQGSARRLLLAAGEEDRVLLCWYSGEDGLFYFCETGLSCSLHLDPAVQDVEGNHAEFAFESFKLSQLLRPYTLVTEDINQQIYGADNPLTEEKLGELLELLEFSEDSHVSVSGGDAYLDGTARLEIRRDGTVTYSDGHEGKYLVSAAGQLPTTAEMIEASRVLTDASIGADCGEAQLYLESIRQTEDGWLVRFGYRINGSAVWLYEEGWAAQFLIREGCISAFTLCYRAYAPTGDDLLLLPMDKAAVILPQLIDGVGDLVIRYRDRGSYLVTPGWIAVQN